MRDDLVAVFPVTRFAPQVHDGKNVYSLRFVPVNDAIFNYFHIIPFYY
jgi:hypothetical protein